jgi:glycine/D-amino acid oxidase-like deaminating enzyme
VQVTTDPDRLEEYRRVAAFDRLCGVDVHEVGPGEVKGMWPLARTDDILAGFYVAEDGRANPVDVTMSLARGARMGGVRILEGVPVTGVLKAGGTVTGVRTPYGDIEAEYVVNCAGMWARQLGEQAGVNIPLQAAEHYYLITNQSRDGRLAARAGGPVHPPNRCSPWRPGGGGPLHHRCGPTADGDGRFSLSRRDHARKLPPWWQLSTKHHAV